MRNAQAKRKSEKKKKPKARKAPAAKQARAKKPSPQLSKKPTPQVSKDICKNCSKVIASDERALFVEEEVGRIFCSEDCIAGFFGPEIERLEKEYFRKLSPNDLSNEDRERLSHLRWITLQEADEVWREKTLSGDYRYTLISEFQPDQKKVWCVCICLFLKGEPSFLYMAFPTRNAAMVNTYRRGERVQMVRNELSPGSPLVSSGTHLEEAHTKSPTDGLADAWTEDETLRAQLTQERNQDDIPIEEFAKYQVCIEQTLENPDEVWSIQVKDKRALKLFHFIRHYTEEGRSGHWYIIVARETENEEQIEILDAFPTRDVNLTDRYRRGKQEVGALDSRPHTRIVH